VQAYSIAVFNGPLAIKIAATLGKSDFVVATVTGVLGFLQGYINGWDMGE